MNLHAMVVMVRGCCDGCGEGLNKLDIIVAACLCVKGGGRDALSGGVGIDADNCVKGRRFLPPSPGYAVKSFWAEAKLG